MIALAGLVGTILYLGFLAVRYPWYENLAVVLVIAVMVPTLITAVWISWAHRLVRWAKDDMFDCDVSSW